MVCRCFGVAVCPRTEVAVVSMVEVVVVLPFVMAVGQWAQERGGSNQIRPAGGVWGYNHKEWGWSVCRYIKMECVQKFEWNVHCSIPQCVQKHVWTEAEAHRCAGLQKSGYSSS
eukprot:scaffold52233_cov26-Tisochrysis_lutea.AAC.2